MRVMRSLAFVIFVGAVIAGAEGRLFANFYAFQVGYQCDTWADYMCPEQLPAGFTATCDPGGGGFFCDDGDAACEDFCGGSQHVDNYTCDPQGYVYCTCTFRFCA